MAEYYPLLAKAVASLPNSTTDTRRVIYERARKALLGQLRNLQPPVAEDDIARESEALDAAVSRLESEFAAAPPPGPPLVTLTPTLADDSSPPVAPPIEPQAGSEVGPQVGAPDKLASPFLAPRPRVPRPPPAVPPRPPLRPWTPFTAGRAAQPDAVPGAAESAAPVEAVEPPSEASSPVDEATEIAASSGAAPPDAEAPIVPGPAPEEPSSPIAVGLPAARSRPEAQRPFAPQPPRTAVPQRRTWIVAAVVGVIVVAVALAAYKLRDRPEDLARLRPVGSDPSVNSSGKVADRVGGTSSPAPAPQPAPVPVPSGDAAPAPVPQPAPQQAPLAVAHRAALLVEAPDEPTKVKTYIGTVVWKLDNVSNGPGQPLSTAVRADVDIPDAKLQASFVFQKNMDATLPASHTIKIQFTVGAGAPIGSIRQINVPQMRKEDAQAGENLSGIPVPITDNSFLVGLSRGPSEETNIDLLRTRAWLDLPMLLTSGRIAKMTIEKSTSGQRAFDDALASWQQPGQ